MAEVKRLLVWGIALALITLSALGTGIYLMYRAGYQEQAQHLQDIADTQAALITSVARFDQNTSRQHISGEPVRGSAASTATLQQIQAAFTQSRGLGRTGEFVLGTRQGDNAVILSHQRDDEHSHEGPLAEGRGEPLRMALSGRSGIFVGRDYHGERVLAALRPLPEHDWALVAKQDLSEIRAPYIRYAGIAGFGALGLIGLGGLFFRRALQPIISGLRRSRTHYNRLLRMAGQGILYIDAQERISLANRKASQILHLPPDVEGKPLLDVLPDEIRTQIAKKLENRQSGQIDEFGITVTFGGESRHLDVTATPLFDDNGNDDGVLVMFSDETDAHGMQQSLIQERQMMHSVLDALPVGVWAVDANGHFILHNPAGEAIWQGVRYEGGQGAYTEYKGWWAESGELIQPGEWAVARAVNNGQTSLNEVIDIQCFDGSRKTILNSAVPMFDADGGIRGAIIVNEDITRRREVERLMQRNEQLLERVLENLPEGVAIADDQGRYIMTNESDVRIWGFNRLGQTANAFPGVAHRDGRDHPVADNDWPVHRVLASCEPLDRDVLEVIRRSDGERRWLSCSAAPVFGDDDQLWGAVEFVQDVTRRRQQQAEMRKLSDAVRHSADAIFVLDTQGRLEFCNPAFSEVTGYSLDDVHGRRPEDFLQQSPEAVTSYKRMLELAQNAESAREVVTNRDKRNRLFQWDCTLSPILDSEGRVVNYVVTATDLSEEARIRDELHRATRYDPLTGLSNRDRLHEQVEQALAGTGHRPHVTGLIKLDIIGFSMINEKHGHSVGDAVLREAAGRLSDTVREGDVVGRVGADGFGILLNDVAREEDIGAVVQKVIDAFNEPLVIDGEEVPCAVNMGVAVSPADGEDAENLIRHANVALSNARQDGVTTRFYARQQGEQARRRLTLEVALREAIEQEQFELYFQPQIELRDGHMRGMETLIRWQHPELGMVSPGEFIPLAEKTGLITRLSPWVLRNALLQRAAWRKDGYDPGRIAVNLSARDFADPYLPDRIYGILQETGEPADGLELEITETMLMEQGETQMTTLRELSEMGITISVDDFGTGYSSLAYLSVMPISLLKIDRSFINSVSYETDTNAAIVRSIISMAQSLGLEVVAEGVETQWQLDFLTKLRCDMAQGFYLARPAPALEIQKEFRRKDWLVA